MDKFLHFFCCFFIAAVVEILVCGVFGASKPFSGLVGWTAAMTVGVVKELYDKRKEGLFDMKDLAADAVGATAAFLCCFLM